MGKMRAKWPESMDFMAWLRNSAGYCTTNAVTIGLSQHGRALFATRNVAAGSRLFEVPRSVIITPESLPPKTIDLLGTTNPKTRLSLLIIAENFKGQASRWYTYLRCLPRNGEIESTIFWDNEELSVLRYSPAYRETIECVKIINSEYHTLESQVLPHCLDVLGKVSLTDFMHAYSTVCSRSWERRGGDDDSAFAMSMIPFADFLNHDAHCQTRLSYDRKNDCAMAVADRDYETGDEVFLSYGSIPNSIRAVDYGFAVACNPHEQVKISMGVLDTDPLRQVKLQTLSRHNMGTDLNADGSASGTKNFTFRDGDLEERGSMALAPLYAFARIICANSHQDFEEMAEESIKHDVYYGLSPRRDQLKESEAALFVANRIKHHLDQHSSALKDLDNVAISPSKRSIAANVLSGELRVLENLYSHCSSSSFLQRNL